jgi:hypothetical protein
VTLKNTNSALYKNFHFIFCMLTPEFAAWNVPSWNSNPGLAGMRSGSSLTSYESQPRKRGRSSFLVSSHCNTGQTYLQ